MVTKCNDARGMLILANLQTILAAYDQENISLSKQALQCSHLNQLMQHASAVLGQNDSVSCWWCESLSAACAAPTPAVCTTETQVEHGITEMVNGDVDIVEWMLRLQLPHFLKPLDLETCEPERSGWAIEVRSMILM